MSDVAPACLDLALWLSPVMEAVIKPSVLPRGSLWDESCGDTHTHF